jgi:hypothetical protein
MFALRNFYDAVCSVHSGKNEEHEMPGMNKLPVFRWLASIRGNIVAMDKAEALMK